MSHRLPVADIQFIADFAAFARSKGDEAYDYLDPDVGCALAQFGHPGVDFIDGANTDGIPEAVDGAAVSYPWTFSALASRLEALIADAPMVRA